ncbi:unnamed protein product [Rhizophagus irregularis]|nr:unnamed protein product [Rhizophagus irregularis]
MKDTKKEGKNEIIILKRFKNPQYAEKYFLRELKSNHHCYHRFRNVIKIFGFTKDPELDDYILVMQYAMEGDLHKYLQKKFTEINWKQKIIILYNILIGLNNIHDENFMHRDFHSGNILVELDYRSSELIRKKLIDSKKLGPKFSEKPHSKAIYTSRSLNSYISRCSSINFSSNDYTSKELELDIDIESGLNSLGIKRNIEELNINSCENNGKRIKN